VAFSLPKNFLMTVPEAWPRVRARERAIAHAGRAGSAGGDGFAI